MAWGCYSTSALGTGGTPFSPKAATLRMCMSLKPASQVSFPCIVFAGVEPSTLLSCGKQMLRLPTTSQWSLSSSCTARLTCQHGVLTSPCPSVIPTARHCSPYTLKESLKNSWVDTVLVFHNIGLDRLSIILTPPCPCMSPPCYCLSPLVATAALTHSRTHSRTLGWTQSSCSTT